MAAAGVAAQEPWQYQEIDVPVYFFNRMIVKPNTTEPFLGQVYKRPDGTWSPTHVHFMVLDPLLEGLIQLRFFPGIQEDPQIIIRPDVLNGEKIEYGILSIYPVAVGEELRQDRILERLEQLKRDATQADLDNLENTESQNAPNFVNRYSGIRQNIRHRFVPENAMNPVTLDTGANLEEGTNMVNFHNELAKYKRFYTQANFNQLALNENSYKENPSTRQRILRGNLRRYKSTSKKGRFTNMCKNGVCAVQGGRRRQNRKTRKATKSLKRK